MRWTRNNSIRLAFSILFYYLSACAHENPRDNHNSIPLLANHNGSPITSTAPPTTSTAKPSPMVDNLASIKLLIGYSYVRGNIFPEQLIPNWSIRLKMTTSKSDFLSFDRGGTSFLLNAKRGEKQDESVFRYTVTDTAPVPVFATPTLHTRCGVKPWVIYNTFALISSLDKKTILWAAHPSSSGDTIIIVEPHNFNRLKCSKATFPT